MPRRPGRPCNAPGCPVIVTGPVSYCEEHQRLSPRRQYDQRRGTSAQRGYDGRWQKIRLWYLRKHPLCAHCQAAGRVEAATDVHHKIPKRDGGTDEEDNLEALCHSCHSKVTAAGG